MTIPKIQILLFDVNKTLLNLQALRFQFERTFGDGRVMGAWCGLMLRLSLVATVTRTYWSFAVLGKDALAITVPKYRLTLSSAAIDTNLGDMLHLPPHPEVIPVLILLQNFWFRLARLTNSAPPALATQLNHASLTGFSTLSSS